MYSTCFSEVFLKAQLGETCFLPLSPICWVFFIIASNVQATRHLHFGAACKQRHFIWYMLPLSEYKLLADIPLVQAYTTNHFLLPARIGSCQFKNQDGFTTAFVPMIICRTPNLQVLENSSSSRSPSFGCIVQSLHIHIRRFAYGIGGRYAVLAVYWPEVNFDAFFKVALTWNIKTHLLACLPRLPRCGKFVLRALSVVWDHPGQATIRWQPQEGIWRHKCDSTLKDGKRQRRIPKDGLRLRPYWQFQGIEETGASSWPDDRLAKPVRLILFGVPFCMVILRTSWSQDEL